MRRRLLKRASKTSRLHCLVRPPGLQAIQRLPRVPHLATGGASSCHGTVSCTPKSSVTAAGAYVHCSGAARRGACRCVRDGCSNAATLCIWRFKAWGLHQKASCCSRWRESEGYSNFNRSIYPGLGVVITLIVVGPLDNYILLSVDPQTQTHTTPAGR